jgi:hypothetical protein
MKQGELFKWNENVEMTEVWRFITEMEKSKAWVTDSLDLWDMFEKTGTMIMLDFTWKNIRVVVGAADNILGVEFHQLNEDGEWEVVRFIEISEWEDGIDYQEWIENKAKYMVMHYVKSNKRQIEWILK